MSLVVSLSTFYQVLRNMPFDCTDTEIGFVSNTFQSSSAASSVANNRAHVDLIRSDWIKSFLFINDPSHIPKSSISYKTIGLVILERDFHQKTLDYSPRQRSVTSLNQSAQKIPLKMFEIHWTGGSNGILGHRIESVKPCSKTFLRRCSGMLGTPSAQPHPKILSTAECQVAHNMRNPISIWVLLSFNWILPWLKVLPR